MNHSSTRIINSDVTQANCPGCFTKVDALTNGALKEILTLYRSIERTRSPRLARIFHLMNILWWAKHVFPSILSVTCSSVRLFSIAREDWVDRIRFSLRSNSGRFSIRYFVQEFYNIIAPGRIYIFRNSLASVSPLFLYCTGTHLVRSNMSEKWSEKLSFPIDLLYTQNYTTVYTVRKRESFILMKNVRFMTLTALLTAITIFIPIAVPLKLVIPPASYTWKPRCQSLSRCLSMRG